MQYLKEFNRARQATGFIDHNKECQNNIACDVCGDELWDTNPMFVLASCPPQKDIHCKTCGFVGYRYA